MDLIYADAQGDDIGVLTHYSLDNEASTNAKNCTFELESAYDDEVYKEASYIYVEGEEYGGIIDSHRVKTNKGIMYLSGRTWRGVLASKIIVPDSGEAYYTVNDDINAILRTIITRTGLSDLFKAKTTESGITVSYQFARYTDAYTGLIKMLKGIGYKLLLEWNLGKILITAEPLTDYSEEEELTSDLFDFEIKSTDRFVNHMIGLGSGELENRQVVHRYVQEDGTVGETQYYQGINEIVDVYDYSNAESLDDLIANTEEQLEKAMVESSVKITANNLECDIGDLFSALDIYTGTSVKQYVTNKITKINNDKKTISYKVGTIK